MLRLNCRFVSFRQSLSCRSSFRAFRGRGAFKKAAEVINSLCDEIDAAKEKEEAKERPSPHTPYREKGKEKKKCSNNNNARARA